MNEEIALSKERINELVEEQLQTYNEKSPLEQYAIFMGKAQMLELILKNLLIRSFAVSPDSLERSTLGQVKNRLEQNAVRPDFISLLESVVQHRNNMAHQYLVNCELTLSLAQFSDKNLYGDLFRAIYELEQIFILCEWCDKNEGWS